MKEVRYNDKMWFGKHKGTRISDLIKLDPDYIQKIINDGVITLDNKGKEYFEEILHGGRRRPNRFGLPPQLDELQIVEPQLGQRVEPEISSSRNYSVDTMNFNLRDTITHMVNQFVPHYPLSILSTVSNVFVTKITNLRLHRLSQTVNLRLIKTDNDISHLTMVVQDNELVEISRFTVND